MGGFGSFGSCVVEIEIFTARWLSICPSIRSSSCCESGSRDWFWPGAAALTVCHPLRWPSGWFPPRQLSSLVYDWGHSVESPHGRWLPGDGLRIVTEGKCILAVYWEEMGEEYELSRSGPPCRVSMKPKFPSHSSLVSPGWCHLLNWHSDTQNNLLNWIRHKDLWSYRKRKMSLMIYLRVWFQSVFYSIIPSWAEILWK